LKAARKRLRKGFTTGTCAAAAAKAAAQALFKRLCGRKAPLRGSVPVTLPSGKKARIKVKGAKLLDETSAWAVVIKDAGDDPDVTNGAEIAASVEILKKDAGKISVRVRGGEGVGVVTRPGLKVGVGRPAINPVPLKMIRTSVMEAAMEAGVRPSVTVTVSVPEGKRLALKTMNPRLGIIGGISILGTTGIVEPLSLSAYTHSIRCAMDVALSSGLHEIVLSTGRSSESAVEKILRLPPEAFVLTGDHMGYALREASKKKGLKKVIIAGQFGKFSKLSAGRFETHCADSSVELGSIAGIARDMGAEDPLIDRIKAANTAREAFFIVKSSGLAGFFAEVQRRVRDNALKITGKGKFDIEAVLVGYNNEITSS